ncbi:MAG: ATP-binding protein [Bacteroidota bacterium]
MEEKFRILMLEDLEEDAVLIDLALEKENIHFTRMRVDSPEHFTAALDNYKPDVVLSDHSLPQLNSIEALEIFKNKGVNVPFILVTGAVSEEFAVNCLKRGVDDYILKSNLSRLPSAIRHALREKELENIRRDQEVMVQKKNEELIKINAELDSFVYNLSHNLRAPLSSILGVLNIAKLDKEKSKEKSEYYLEMIENSILRLDETIRGILDYSQNVRTGIVNSEIHFEPLIQKCVERLKYLDGYDLIERNITVLGDFPFVSDSYRISIALTNVIANAIMYRDQIKACAYLRIVATVDPDLAKIIITDNGVGISPELLTKVFDMFYRANEKSQGAGLGLYIAREVMGRIGGSIDITSTQFEGTSVTLRIPNQAKKPVDSF